MSSRRKIFLVAGLPALAVLAWWLLLPGTPGLLLQLFAIGWLLVGSIWLTREFLRRFLWRVSRRLAFSYFLIGIVPIPLVSALVALTLYILSGFFLGHLYSDSLASLQDDLQSMAQVELDRLLGQLQDLDYAPAAARFAYYRDNRRFAGDSKSPPLFRDFLPRGGQEGEQSTSGVILFADSEGQPTLFGAAVSGRFAVVARLDGSLEAELRRRTGLWIELVRADARDTSDGRVVFHYQGRKFPLAALRPSAPREEIREFTAERRQLELAAGEALPRLERPWLVWLEVSRPFLDPLTGQDADDYVTATLVTSPAVLVAKLWPAAPEVNFFAFLVFLTVFVVTLNVYIVALLMASMMIFGLSRAVNRLTDATRRVQQGDFGARIEVHRADQVGALQRSFNSMAANLEKAVSEAAQKEIFERELEIAAETQKSLLPDTLDAPEPLHFATYFQPSRAIGGDYYDVLRLADDRLAVVVADVAGHGLPAGMRMAMVKSALELLCRDHDSPRKILESLHHLLRERLHKKGERRAFVTATLAAFDLETRKLEIVGAGHPPTYRLRGGHVRPIELPGPPLGILPPTLPTAHLDVEPGDVFVWLSDGLLEAKDPADEVFGYQRVISALEGLESDPEKVKEALLAAVATHCRDARGELRIDDDLTLVVMAYRPESN